MIKQDFHIANLIARHLSGKITPKETEQLNSWRNESISHENLFKKICKEENYRKHIEKSHSFNTETGWSEVKKQIKKDNQNKHFINVLGYAAAILLPILFIGISIRYSSHSHGDQQTLMAHHPILPGQAKAILTLDNGQTINLNKEAGTELQKLEGTSIVIDSTTLNYQTAQSALPKTRPIYNKVEIPRGGEYALVLSDGTKVHLNSMSSLRFPVTFANEKREVELEGEAYFEVSKNGLPFIVSTHGMQIEVLGTTFNVSAYPNEECQTTLVNGSVKINAGQGESLILKPSQQASIAPGSNDIQVKTVDTSFYTSWIKGKINFKDQRLEDIMKILSRWYDMKVVYANADIKNIRFGCNIDRYEDIAPFVNLLEKTEKVHVKIKDKTITFYN